MEGTDIFLISEWFKNLYFIMMLMVQYALYTTTITGNNHFNYTMFRPAEIV